MIYFVASFIGKIDFFILCQQTYTVHWSMRLMRLETLKADSGLLKIKHVPILGSLQK